MTETAWNYFYDTFWVNPGKDELKKLGSEKSQILATHVTQLGPLKQKLWMVHPFISTSVGILICFSESMDHFNKIKGKNQHSKFWPKLPKNAKGSVKDSFWGGLVISLNSKLTINFQVHRPQRIQSSNFPSPQTPENAESMSESKFLPVMWLSWDPQKNNFRWH